MFWVIDESLPGIGELVKYDQMLGFFVALSIETDVFNRELC